jgi:hypothetical protein
MFAVLPGEVFNSKPELKAINARYHFAFHNLAFAIAALYHISVEFSNEI